MPYIGRDTDKLSNVEVLDKITFDGSQSYTLQKGGANFTPSSANNILISIDGVVQANNFTCSSSTIDFGVAIASSSTCDFILHYGVGLITTPADGTITNAKLAASAINSQTAETSIAGGDEVLIYDTSASALRKMTRTNFVSGIGGVNTPAFRATRDSTQTISANTTTKIQYDDVSFDTDNCYDNSTNYRFTPGVAGKYIIGASAGTNAQSDHNHLSVEIQKNGTAIAYNLDANQHLGVRNMTILDEANTTDYYEVYIRQDNGTDTTPASAAVMFFFAHKIIE